MVFYFQIFLLLNNTNMQLTCFRLFLLVLYSLVALTTWGAIPSSPKSSSSIKSSGFCLKFSDFSDLELLNSPGSHPSSEPTVLKNPAENPPVKAPWNLRRPWASVAICSSTEMGRFLGTASTKTEWLTGERQTRQNKANLHPIVLEACHRSKNAHCLPRILTLRIFS